MPLYPHRQYVVETSLPPGRVAALLESLTQPVDRWQRRGLGRPFEGDVSGDRFRLRPRGGLRGGGVPFLVGRVEPRAGTAAGGHLTATAEVTPGHRRWVAASLSAATLLAAAVAADQAHRRGAAGLLFGLEAFLLPLLIYAIEVGGYALGAALGRRALARELRRAEAAA